MTDYRDEERKGEFSSKTEDWVPWMLQEIDRAVNSGRKRLNPWEDKFLGSIRVQVKHNRGLTSTQASDLRKLYERCTEPRRIKYGSHARP